MRNVMENPSVCLVICVSRAPTANFFMKLFMPSDSPWTWASCQKRQLQQLFYSLQYFAFVRT